MSIKVKLLRQLDGKDVGSEVEYPDADAKRLDARGVVKIIGGKAAPEAQNKKAPEADNKAAGVTGQKKGQ